MIKCVQHLTVSFSTFATQSVKTVTDSGKEIYPINSINVLKAHGKSARESALLGGYALNMGRASQGMPKRVKNAKIACLDFNLQKARMHMGIQVSQQPLSNSFISFPFCDWHVAYT